MRTTRALEQRMAAIVNRHSERKIRNGMLLVDVFTIVADLLEKWEPSQKAPKEETKAPVKFREWL